MAFDIVFLVFPKITQLDFTGPAQMLARLPDTRVHVAARDPGPIDSGCGFGIVPSTGFDDCPPADLLCVPGGHGVQDAVGDAATVEFVRRQAEGARYVTSVCTGALLLGAAGLLRGRRATTHWGYTDLLALCGATFQRQRVVVDGNLITGGGVTCGIDFGLVVAAELAGADTAREIQLALEYDPAPPFPGGHPDAASAQTLAAVKPAYDAASERMREALEAAVAQAAK